MDKEKSVAVLTWKLNNYGTALQAFALNQYIRDMGYKCDLVNYSLEYKNLERVNKKHSFRWDFQSFSKMAERLYSRKKRKFYNGRKQSLEKLYIDRIQLSKERFSSFYLSIPHIGEERFEKQNLVLLLSRYQSFVCGSDQIWNPKFLDGAYYLDFVKNAKRIAYAPSIGVTELTEEESSYIIPRIQSFDFVSVREKQAAELLKKHGIEDVTVVLDPTLLLDRAVWDREIPYDKIIKTSKKIVFVYLLEDNRWYLRVVKKLKKKLPGMLWVTIPKTVYAYTSSSFDKMIPEAGPAEFVNLLRQSAFVLTDSYHGVCMAIKYHKEFVALQRFQTNTKYSENSRLESLLGILELKSRLFDKVNVDGIDISEINWNQTDEKVKQLAIFSDCFLEKSLS